MIVPATRVSLVLAVAAFVSACGGASDTSADAHAPTDPAVTSSSAGLPAGNVGAGEQLAQTKGKATGQSCVDCHGADGNAPLDPSYPKLGGQHRDYIGHALQMYRDGKRENPLMASQAKDLNDQQIADLSAYFASRPSQLRDLHGTH